MHEPWQVEQGKRCGCNGTDEFCGCQNTKHGEIGAACPAKFRGTRTQLFNALREAGRRGGEIGAICAAAADEITRLNKGSPA